MILYCISDHGFGHATRAIPIINALKDDVIVRHSTAAQVLKRETGANVLEEGDGPGIVHQDLVTINPEATKARLEEWDWTGTVSRIRELIREYNVNLVIADSSPEPFLAAREEKIPSVFLGSFTWLEIYDSLGILSDEQRDWMRDAYGAASAGIRLPLGLPCDGVNNLRDVGLVSRHPNGSVQENDRSALFTLGGSLSLDRTPNFSFTGTLRTSSRFDVGYQRTDETVLFTNYVNAADVLLGKCGYGTVSEAITCRKPMLLVKRAGFAEDESIVSEIERLGIGRAVTAEELLSFSDAMYDQAVALQKNYKDLPERLRRDGTPEAVRIIEEFL